MSQSLHFLRAFQPVAPVRSPASPELGRNPFIFLGHFNSALLSRPRGGTSRNPFIFLGHFNFQDQRHEFNLSDLVAIPSFS